MSGWIKIHREIQRHWIAQCPEKLGRWVDLLLLVNYEDSKVLVGDRLINVKRGQMVMSFDFLAKRWNISKSTASAFIELLESDNMVERHTEQRKTILTICNYESYQQVDTDEPNDVPYDCRTIAERCPNELKNVEEDKEINIYLTNAPVSRTREENPAWDEARESGFVERFKAQGSARLIMRVTGKSPEDVMRLLDVYLASRQMKDLGHKDFNHFLEAFQYAIKNNKISIPVTPAQPKERKVISGADVLKVYG